MLCRTLHPGQSANRNNEVCFQSLNVFNILQVVWKGTKEVGFGIAISGPTMRDADYTGPTSIAGYMERITVANYSPPGNRNRKSIICENVELTDGELILNLVPLHDRYMTLPFLGTKGIGNGCDSDGGDDGGDSGIGGDSGSELTQELVFSIIVDQYSAC